MDLHQKTYDVLLNDIVNYIKSFYGCNESLTLEGIIPSATLLTGVNQPDHVSQFEALIHKIRDEVTPHTAMVNSQDASTIKHLVENTVWQLINDHEILDASAIESEDETTPTKKLKKNQCTMTTLQNWYRSKYLNSSPKKKHTVSMRSLVIIIPDFESFNCNVLQDFVMIISSYLSSLPIVFVFGVATSVSALHKSFPYHVSSKLLIKVFHSHSSPVYMNQVLEDIFLNYTSPLHLSGKAFELLTDVFLFYDFSVTGLIQSIKYCMMEHYYCDNVKSLCCERSNIENAVFKLCAEDLEAIRQLPSFRPYLESQPFQTKISLFENDDFFKDVLCTELNRRHNYLQSFYLSVRVLAAFLKDLPKNVIGKTVREIYTKCVGEFICQSLTFKECMQLINFQSQVKLIDSIKGALKVIGTEFASSPTKKNTTKTAFDDNIGENFTKTVRIHLLTFLGQLQNASTEATILTQTADEAEYDMEVVPGNRYKLKEQLLRATRVDKVQSEFEMIRARFVSYLEEMFAEGLQPPFTQTFHEILFFSDVASVKKQIVGAPRGAVHTALSNPVQYLQIVIAALALVAVVVAAPAEQPAKVVNILRSEHDLQPDGAYHYNFETEDGTSRNENGELKVVNDAENKPQQVLTVRGSYSYVDPEGHSHSVTYVADETGFHAESNDLSKTQS
ncbi:hypothetical protein MSG28_007518 [Choristoneura fumiferana]|uniref:Uncharacterized protein n=3 Tax=Choristoneura fumiferana TaxID=7141 RepID=A0ACC0JXW9_CHOFU|nr:hypothetical protein MSG28_007518 [Choristoneura fumiferana]KAI8428882.1 hypothetical protein MSG28_007518 [Choristoneura fumiferana]